MWIVKCNGESIYDILGENVCKLTPQKSMESSIFVSLKIEFHGELCLGYKLEIKDKFEVLQSLEVWLLDKPSEEMKYPKV